MIIYSSACYLVQLRAASLWVLQLILKFIYSFIISFDFTIFNYWLISTRQKQQLTKQPPLMFNLLTRRLPSCHISCCNVSIFTYFWTLLVLLMHDSQLSHRQQSASNILLQNPISELQYVMKFALNIPFLLWWISDFALAPKSGQIFPLVHKKYG